MKEVLHNAGTTWTTRAKAQDKESRQIIYAPDAFCTKKILAAMSDRRYLHFYQRTCQRTGNVVYAIADRRLHSPTSRHGETGFSTTAPRHDKGSHLLCNRYRKLVCIQQDHDLRVSGKYQADAR